MNRRGVVVAAAGLAAAAIGIGTALRRRPGDDDEPAEVSVDIWTLAFESVEGAPIVLSSWRGRPLLLNFWATWCAPCVVEMPILDRFARVQGPTGWRVLALAVDQPDPVRRFIAERTLRLPVGLAGSVGLDLSRQLGNAQGGLPFTAAFDSRGSAVRRHLGAVNEALLSSWSKSTS